MFGSVILDVAIVLTYLSLLSIAKSSSTSWDSNSITAAILLFRLLWCMAISLNASSLIMSFLLLTSFLRRFSLAILISSGPIFLRESKSILLSLFFLLKDNLFFLFSWLLSFLLFFWLSWFLFLSFLSFLIKSNRPIISPN